MAYTLGMNRRGFLLSMLASATLDPERLLWRPGEKLISIPKPAIASPLLHFESFTEFRDRLWAVIESLNEPLNLVLREDHQRSAWCVQALPGRADACIWLLRSLPTYS
jgi:hypothetical protein